MAYLGDVHYAKGLYAGVVMNDPMQGKNNGKNHYLYHGLYSHYINTYRNKSIQTENRKKEINKDRQENKGMKTDINTYIQTEIPK